MNNHKIEIIKCGRLTHSSPPTAPPIFSHTLLNFPIYKDIPDNHDSSPFSLFSRHFGQELVKIFWLIIGLSFLCLALRANIDIPVNADLIQILKKEYSDWEGNKAERLFFICRDRQIFQFRSNNGKNRVSVKLADIIRTLARNGNNLGTVWAVVHNHKWPEDFSEEDRKLLKILRDYGFQGKFLIYYPEKGRIRELTDPD